MSIHYGSTMRLHHIDFPTPLNEKSREWARRDSVSSTGSSGSHMELSPPPITNHSFTSNPTEIEIRDKKTLESYGVETNNQPSAHGAFNTEKTVKSDVTRQTVTSKINSQAGFNGQFANISVNIEWDVLESFAEFATFLENKNPICPADLLDTPEKLMSVLVWKHFRAH